MPRPISPTISATRSPFRLPARCTRLVEPEEELELLVAREERRARRAAEAHRARGLVLALARDPEHDDRLGDALHVNRRHAVELEAVVDETLGRRADEHVAGLRRALDAARRR